MRATERHGTDGQVRSHERADLRINGDSNDNNYARDSVILKNISARPMVMP